MGHAHTSYTQQQQLKSLKIKNQHNIAFASIGLSLRGELPEVINIHSMAGRTCIWEKPILGPSRERIGFCLEEMSSVGTQ